MSDERQDEQIEGVDEAVGGVAGEAALPAGSPGGGVEDEEARAGGAGEPGIGGAGAASEKLLRARQVVTELCARLGAQVDVEVRDSAEAIACNVQVRSGGQVFEVGPRGQVLEALQYLVNRMVNRDAEGRKWISVELGTFRESTTDPAMVEMATRLGEAARRIGKTLTVVPMQSRDRRVVHQALSEMEGVRTRSEGEGILRRLLVEPDVETAAED
ncbi:protein jag [Vulgatibacter sp.]|uniref:Jag family protein n=1 Tax=Vulgatibacter sp. TaxID=1971226 RepID=UPI003567D302